MRRLLRSIRQFLSELRRRNVYRVALAYLAAGLAVVELADIAAGAFDLPGWFQPMVWTVCGLGFPIALVMAWALEVTPEGLRVEEPEGSGETPSPGGVSATSTGLIVGLLALAIGLQLYPSVLSSGEGTGEEEGPTAIDTTQVDERSIAVLPFEPLSKGEESETFAQGVHDDLLTRLSNISDLKVTSRTSVQKYRDTDLSLPAIADSLGVRWVMEGGVQVLQNQIQVNAQLIDPRSDAHVWADDYRRDLTAENLFAIQGEITREIADALKAELTAGEQERIAGAPTENLQAYRLYVKGRSELDSRTEDGMRRAVEYFRQALQEDSTYALAWSGLADAAILVPIYGPDTLDVPQPGYEAAARRALELDPDLAEAHASMAGVYFEKRNAPSTLQHLRRAVDLKPSYAHAHSYLGFTWLVTGRLEEALEHYRLAVELNSHLTTARTGLVGVLLSQGDVKKAEAQLGRLTQEQRQTLEFKAFKKDVLYYAGQWGRLEALAKKHLESGVGHEGTQRFYLARIAVREGDTTAAREHLAKVPTLKNKNHARPYWEGLLHAVLGESDSAFAAWREVQDWGPFSSWSFRYYYPDVLGPLREDPRYEETIREINRHWGLNPDGSIPEDTSVPTISTDQ